MFNRIASRRTSAANERFSFVDELVDDQASVSDLTAVRADDDFLSALAAGRLIRLDSKVDQELSDLLAGWRGTIVDAPMPAGLDLESLELASARATAEDARRKNIRILKIVSAAAAAALFAFGGLAAIAYQANPGDPLYNVKQVMFGGSAESATAANNARELLVKAETALEVADISAARDFVAQAQTQINRVDSGDTRDGLQRKLNDLVVKINAASLLNSQSVSSARVTVTVTAKTKTKASSTRRRVPSRTSSTAIRPTLPGTSIQPTGPSVPTETSPSTSTSTPSSSTSSSGSTSPSGSEVSSTQSPTGPSGGLPGSTPVGAPVTPQPGVPAPPVVPEAK